LRERKEDIPLLIERFLAAADSRYAITNEAMQVLLEYEWPGNIRELKNCLERMMAFSSGPLLHRHDLPTTVLAFIQAQQAGTMSAVAGSVSTRTATPPSAPLLPPSPTGEVIPLHELERSLL
jgi:DNA-binding NtrC family response regulator